MWLELICRVSTRLFTSEQTVAIGTTKIKSIKSKYHCVKRVLNLETKHG
jgi:hypothetical protein